MALSSHLFNTWDFASRGFKLMLFCGGMLAFLGLLFVLGLTLLQRSPDVGATVMAVSLLMMLINVWLLHSHFQYRSQGVASIDICPNGIRWLKKSGEAAQRAGWADITHCELNHTSPYPWRHSLLLRLSSGATLRFAAFSLTDYHAFAKHVYAGFQQRANAHGDGLHIGGYQTLKTMSKLAK